MASDKRITFGSLDRLSNSPREIIDEILLRMPIRDAVKTSLLSKGWRYRWMSMTDLVFDSRSILLCAEQKPITTNLVYFVNKLLLLHQGIVSKFELNKFLEHGCSDVDHWILVLSRKMVSDLQLVFRPYDTYQVPSSLFCCQSLTKLYLQDCIVKLPSDYQGFSCLTELALSSVTLTNDTFHNLLLKIPLLQMLCILDCISLTHFNIHSPNLIVITIVGECESINFQNAPNVKDASIRLSLPGFPVKFKLDDDGLQVFDRLKHLELYHPYVEHLPADIAPERFELGITYHHLTELSLHVNFEDLKQVLAVLCLCKSAPCLKWFKIHASWDRESALLHEENFWEARFHKEDAVFKLLKTVSLSHFQGVKNDMDFVHFILLNGNLFILDQIEEHKKQWEVISSLTKRLLPLEGLDRISSLPTEVIERILKQVLMKTVVQTCILAKSWKNKWKFVPYLVLKKTCLISSLVEAGPTQDSLVNFIGNVLMHHQGTIIYFILVDYLDSGCSDIDRWILLLSSKEKQLQRLALKFKSADSYQVPDCLFSYRTLTHLSLRGCILQVPLKFDRLNCLVYLSLCNVNVTSEAIETVVTKSPWLIYLNIEDCSSLTWLNIKAPRLRTCRVKGPCKKVHFKIVPKLEYAEVVIWLPNIFTRCQLNKVLCRGSHIKILHLSYPIMEPFPGRLRRNYRHLKYVHLLVNLEDTMQLLAILYLCRSSPKLKNFSIKVIQDRQFVLSHDEHFWGARLKKEESIFRRLKYMKLVGFMGVT